MTEVGDFELGCSRPSVITCLIHCGKEITWIGYLYYVTSWRTTTMVKLGLLDIFQGINVHHELHQGSYRAPADEIYIGDRC